MGEFLTYSEAAAAIGVLFLEQHLIGQNRIPDARN